MPCLSQPLSLAPRQGKLLWENLPRISLTNALYQLSLAQLSFSCVCVVTSELWHTFFVSQPLRRPCVSVAVNRATSTGEKGEREIIEALEGSLARGKKDEAWVDDYVRDDSFTRRRL